MLQGGAGAALSSLVGSGRVQVDVNLPDLDDYLREQALRAKYRTF